MKKLRFQSPDRACVEAGKGGAPIAEICRKAGNETEYVDSYLDRQGVPRKGGGQLVRLSEIALSSPKLWCHGAGPERQRLSLLPPIARTACHPSAVWTESCSR